MRAFTAVVERETETGLLVGHIPGFRGAHSEAATMEEVHAGRDISPILLRHIGRDIGVSPAEFLDF